jgi:sugar/nucleoside kinase (ribokinase family)
MAIARRLVSVGNVVIDVVLRVGALPERGSDVIASAAALSPGGGFNALLAASRSGLASAYGGAHGTGPFGDLARTALTEAGIAVLLPAISDRDTGLVIAIVDAGGERTFITIPGAEAELSLRSLSTLAIHSGDAILMSGYSLLHSLNRIAILGWLNGLPTGALVILDPGPLVADIPADALRSVLDRTDWLTSNAREARLLGTRARGRIGTIVRTGPTGCTVQVHSGAPVDVPGFPITGSIVTATIDSGTLDTNGAGDTHTGAFIAALARGATPIEAAIWANAAAAISVTRMGPATAPTSDEITAFLAQHQRPGPSAI